MTTAISAVPSLNLESLTANLTILVVAVGAAVAGVWNGWQKIKKSLTDDSPRPDERLRVVAATLTETMTLTMLTESNRELKEAVCALERRVSDQAEELRQNRYAIGRASEAMDRMVSSLDHNSRTMERTRRD